MALSAEHLDQVDIIDQVHVWRHDLKEPLGPVRELGWDLEDGVLALRHCWNSYVPCSNRLIYPYLKADWLVCEACRIEYFPVFERRCIVYQYRATLFWICASITMA